VVVVYEVQVECVEREDLLTVTAKIEDFLKGLRSHDKSDRQVWVSYVKHEQATDNDGGVQE